MKLIIINSILLILGCTNISISQNSIDPDLLKGQKSSAYIYEEKKNRETYIAITSICNFEINSRGAFLLFNSKSYKEVPKIWFLSSYSILPDSTYSSFIFILDSLKQFYSCSPYDSNYKDEIIITVDKRGHEGIRLCFYSKENIIFCIKLIFQYLNQPFGINAELIEKYMKNEN
jgi:hypothetical protein